jgi:hypothetical protein
MNTDRARALALAALCLAAPALLAGCDQGLASTGKPASTFGEANSQTMMAKVIDPDPHYEYLDPETSARHAAQAIDRYRNDAVKKPERVRSTESVSSSR